MYNKGSNQLYDFLTSSSNYGQQNDLFSNKINIIFKTMKGNQHIRSFNQNDKIIDVLESFLTSVGVSKNALSKIHFLYNATNINNLNKNMTLNNFNIKNNAVLNVIDINNIIGA